jgi:hypothetical protein
MADILNIQQIGDEPIMGVEGIPFISNNIEELKVLHKYLRPEYEKVALKNNQTILYMVPCRRSTCISRSSANRSMR